MNYIVKTAAQNSALKLTRRGLVGSSDVGNTTPDCASGIVGTIFGGGSGTRDEDLDRALEGALNVGWGVTRRRNVLPDDPTSLVSCSTLSRSGSDSSSGCVFGMKSGRESSSCPCSGLIYQKIKSLSSNPKIALTIQIVALQRINIRVIDFNDSLKYSIRRYKAQVHTI